MPKPVVKEGRVSSARGKFYVTVAGSRKAIAPEVADATILKKMVGQTVPVTIFGRSIVAIGKRPGGGILCYVPAPDVIKVIQADFQKFLEKKFVDAGILTR